MVNGVSTLPVPNQAAAAADSTRSTARLSAGFVAGGENRLLAAVVQEWCHALNEKQETGSQAWQRLASPLVLVGPTGGGKSHLAAGLARLAGDRSYFTTANDLRRDLSTAIEAGTAITWCEQLATVPLLVIDDIDHLPNRGSFQLDLLHLLRESETQGHKIIVTAARPVAHLSGWLPDLVNWFATGLSLEIAPLGSEARRAMILQIAETNDWHFSESTLDALLEHTSPEPRELFRLVDDVERQFGRSSHFKVDTLTHFLHRRKSNQAPDLRDIIRVVSRYHRVPIKLLTSASRQAGVVSARATVIYLARTLTEVSYEQIGRQLGGRDHTTIMHSYRQVEKRLSRETALRSAIDELTRLLQK